MGSAPADPELLLAREWLVNNGLAGYGSGIFPGESRATVMDYRLALSAPLERTVMLSRLAEELRLSRLFTHRQRRSG